MTLTALRKKLRIDFLKALLVHNTTRTFLLETAVHKLNFFFGKPRGFDELVEWSRFVPHERSRVILVVGVCLFLFKIRIIQLIVLLLFVATMIQKQSMGLNMPKIVRMVSWQKRKIKIITIIIVIIILRPGYITPHIRTI